MSLIEKIEKSYQEAFRSVDKEKINTLRMLKAELQNRRIADGKDLEDDAVLQVIKREVKKREEAIIEFRRGDRDDLVQADEKQLVILREYLPEGLSGDELKKIAEDKFNQLGISSPADFGRLMGAVMKEAGGRAEGGQVKEIVSDMLKNKLQNNAEG